MPSIEFDSFLSTLYSAVNSTQKTIDQRQEGVLRRLIEGSETGEAEAVTWMFSVPVVEFALTSKRENFRSFHRV